MLKRFLLSASLLALTAGAAQATLQLSIGVGGSVFTCSDGELSCDVSGGAKNLLVIDQTVGGRVRPAHAHAKHQRAAQPPAAQLVEYREHDGDAAHGHALGE